MLCLKISRSHSPLQQAFTYISTALFADTRFSAKIHEGYLDQRSSGFSAWVPIVYLFYILLKVHRGEFVLARIVWFLPKLGMLRTSHKELAGVGEILRIETMDSAMKLSGSLAWSFGIPLIVICCCRKVRTLIGVYF